MLTNSRTIETLAAEEMWVCRPRLFRRIAKPGEAFNVNVIFPRGADYGTMYVLFTERRGGMDVCGMACERFVVGGAAHWLARVPAGVFVKGKVYVMTIIADDAEVATCDIHCRAKPFKQR